MFPLPQFQEYRRKRRVRYGVFADISGVFAAKLSNDFLKYKKLGRKSGELKCKPSRSKAAGQRGCGRFKILAMPKLLCVRIGYRVIVTGVSKTTETERFKVVELKRKSNDRIIITIISKGIERIVSILFVPDGFRFSNRSN